MTYINTEIVLRLLDRQTDIYRQRVAQNEGEYPHGLITRCSPRLKCVIFLVPSPPPGDLHSTERLRLHFPPSLSFVRAEQSRGIQIISGTITVPVQIALTLSQMLRIYFSFSLFSFLFFSGELYSPPQSPLPQT